MTRVPFLLLTLALMCENVNAAPQGGQPICKSHSQECPTGGPAVAAPFTPFVIVKENHDSNT